MDLYWLDKKLSSIPSGNTIGQIKQHIKKWLTELNINYKLQMVLSNGAMIDPIVFSSNLHDDVVIGDLKGKLIIYSSEYDLDRIYPQNKIDQQNKDEQNKMDEQNNYEQNLKRITTNNKINTNKLTMNNKNNFNLLDKNVLYEILIKMPIRDMIHMCQTSSKLQNICRENELWRRKMMIDYKIIDKPLEISWRTYYIKQYLNIPDFYIDDEGMEIIFDVPAIEISIAVKLNDYNVLVNIDYDWNDDFINNLFEIAHYEVSLEIIKYLILKMKDPRRLDIEYYGAKFDEIGINWIGLRNKIHQYTIKYGVDSAFGAREAVRHYFST